MMLCVQSLPLILLLPSFSSIVFQVADTYTMPTSDGPSRFPVFVPPPQGSQRCPGYVPGRVAPVRSMPHAKTPPPPPIKPHGPPLGRQTRVTLSEENQRREDAQRLQQKLRKKTLICCGVSLGAFFLTLILVLSLSSGPELDGDYLSWISRLLNHFCMTFKHLCVHLSVHIYRELPRSQPISQ